MSSRVNKARFGTTRFNQASLPVSNSLACSVESLLGVLSTRAAGIECATLITSDRIETLESGATIASLKAINLESIIELSILRQSAFEHLVQASRDAQLDIEFGGALTHSQALTLESLTNQAATRAALLEITLQVARAASLHDEGLSSASVANQISIESLVVVLNSISSATEYLSSVSAQATRAEIEYLAALESAATVTLEELENISSQRPINSESLVAISNSQDSHIEAHGKVARDLSNLLEWLTSISRDLLSQAEWMRTVAALKDALIEGSGHIEQSAGPIVEARGLASAERPSNFEFALNLSQERGAAAEWLSQTAQSMAVGLEALGAVTRALITLDEFVGSSTVSRALNLEALVSVAISGQLSVEEIASLLKSSVIDFEFSSQAFSAIQTPIAWVQSLSWSSTGEFEASRTVQAFKPIEIEILTRAATTGVVDVESLKIISRLLGTEYEVVTIGAIGEVRIEAVFSPVISLEALFTQRRNIDADFAKNLKKITFFNTRN